MLAPPFNWRTEPDRAFLEWRFGTIAHVLPRDGAWRVTINWRGSVFGGSVGSLRQGIRFVDRWIAARGEVMPTVRPRRWYDRR